MRELVVVDGKFKVAVRKFIIDSIGDSGLVIDYMDPEDYERMLRECEEILGMEPSPKVNWITEGF